jgi:hypothetical protein
MAMSKWLRVSKLVKCKKYLKVTSNCWKMLKQKGTHRILIKQINKSTRKSVPWKHCLKRATLCNLKGNKKRNTQNKWIPTIWLIKNIYRATNNSLLSIFQLGSSLISGTTKKLCVGKFDMTLFSVMK